MDRGGEEQEEQEEKDGRRKHQDGQHLRPIDMPFQVSEHSTRRRSTLAATQFQAEPKRRKMVLPGGQPAFELPSPRTVTLDSRSGMQKGYASTLRGQGARR
jgi:hypothetical protein